MYLMEGKPGTGKTTAGLQFLLEGRRTGERCLYVTLSEPKAELEATAKSHDWSLDGISIAEFVPDEASIREEEHYTVFHPAELELASTIKRLLAEIEQSRPERLVIDSLSEFRLLAQDAVRYRRQLLALKQYFAGRNTTVLLLNDQNSAEDDQQVLSIMHGVIRFSNIPRSYGVTRRHLEVVKIRASAYREGNHDYSLDQRGMVVYPRLIEQSMKKTFPMSTCAATYPRSTPCLREASNGAPARSSSAQRVRESLQSRCNMLPLLLDAVSGPFCILSMRPCARQR